MVWLLSLLLVAIWLGGALVRVYRQARFYQIEEYKSGRYLRWLIAERERILPRRPLIAVVVAVGLNVFTDQVPDGIAIMSWLIAWVASVIAVWPPDEGEIKKRFNRTSRATRLLGAAFVVVTLVHLLGVTVLAGNMDTESRVWIMALLALGLVVYLVSPLALIAGNGLMMPVEAFFRQRFLRQARNVMSTVQPKVIGITGSYGKTTTKNFLRDILNGRFRAYATPKSYNTLMGVSIAINNDLADDYSVEYFISEMGAYVPGEIARICDLTPPDISIVVEVGPQHLERFGSLENVAIAKYEIIKGLRPDGLGVFNWDNEYVRAMYERGYPDNRIAVSRLADPVNLPANGPRFIATDITESLNGLTFTVVDAETGQRAKFETPVVGQHNVMNLLLATAVAVHEGMPLADVAFRVRTLQPAESRLVREVSANGVTIINDAYSANPVGIVSSLQVLGLHQNGRRVLITPGMIELGDLHEKENRRLGELATEYATDIVLVGRKLTQPIADGILNQNFPSDRLHIVDTLSEAVGWYQSNCVAGDTVLFLNDLPDTY